MVAEQGDTDREAGRMDGLVDRALIAFEKHKRAVKEQEEADKKRLEILVSRIVGASVAGAATKTTGGYLLVVQDGVYLFRFVYADETQASLALRWKCRSCKEDFLILVSTLADLGRMVEVEDAHVCDVCKSLRIA